MDSYFVPLLVVVAGLGILLQRVSVLSARIDRLSRLEGMLDSLLRHAGVHYDPLENVTADVREALERGEYILAIKKLREATGIGLKDAKVKIDELRLRIQSPAQRGEAGR